MDIIVRGKAPSEYRYDGELYIETRNTMYKVINRDDVEAPNL